MEITGGDSLKQIDELTQDHQIDRRTLQRQPRRPPSRPPAMPRVTRLTERHHERHPNWPDVVWPCDRGSSRILKSRSVWDEAVSG